MANLGRDRKLYVNTAGIFTEGDEVWALVGRIENVKRPRSQATSEHDFRESTHTKTVSGNVKMGLEFEYFERPDDAVDAVLAALISAAENGENIQIAVVDGPIETVGTKGIIGIYCISDSPEEQATNDRVKHSFTLMEADEYVDGEVYDVQEYETAA